MMSVVKHDIGTIERVFGMTLVTMPVWFIIFGIGYIKHGLPSSNQVTQSFIVALFSELLQQYCFLCNESCKR